VARIKAPVADQTAVLRRGASHRIGQGIADNQRAFGAGSKDLHLCHRSKTAALWRGNHFSPKIERLVRAPPCFRTPQQIEAPGRGITNINLTVLDQGRKYVVWQGDDMPEHRVMRRNDTLLTRAAAKAGVSPRVHHCGQGVKALDFL
jgi:hypothetical protein